MSFYDDTSSGGEVVVVVEDEQEEESTGGGSNSNSNSNKGGKVKKWGTPGQISRNQEPPVSAKPLEKPKPSGNKIKLPSYLANQEEDNKEEVKSPKPGWMTRLKKRVSVTPSTATDGEEKKEVESIKPVEVRPPPPPPSHSPPSDLSPPPPSDPTPLPTNSSSSIPKTAMNGSKNKDDNYVVISDVQQQIHRIHAATPKQPARKSIQQKNTTATATDTSTNSNNNKDHQQPAWLLTGSVPKGKQLEEDTRGLMAAKLEHKKKEEKEVAKPLNISRNSTPRATPKRNANAAGVDDNNNNNNTNNNTDTDTNGTTSSLSKKLKELQRLKTSNHSNSGTTPATTTSTALDNTKENNNHTTRSLLAPLRSSTSPHDFTDNNKSAKDSDDDVDEVEEFVEESEESEEEVVLTGDEADVFETDDEGDGFETDDEGDVFETDDEEELEVEEEDEADGNWAPVKTDQLLMRHSKVQDMANHKQLLPPKPIPNEDKNKNTINDNGVKGVYNNNNGSRNCNFQDNKNKKGSGEGGGGGGRVDTMSDVTASKENTSLSLSKNKNEINHNNHTSEMESEVPESEAETWFMPKQNDDDSSWVNPTRQIETTKKRHITDDLYKNSVDLFPESSSSSKTEQEHHIIVASLKHLDLQSIAEESKFEGSQPPLVVGMTIDHSTSTPPGADDGISEASMSEMSSKVYENTVPRKNAPSGEGSWSMPPTGDRVYQRLDDQKDGKDYRFSYIASTHTHSTATYSDAVRERLFPEENNEYWGVPERQEDNRPELPLHLSRSGKIESGPRTEDESWMPPENVPNDDANPGLAPDERCSHTFPYSSGVSVATNESEWLPSQNVPSNIKARYKRIDFTGAVTSNDSDESFVWNPELAPSPDGTDNEANMSDALESSWAGIKIDEKDGGHAVNSAPAVMSQSAAPQSTAPQSTAPQSAMPQQVAPRAQESAPATVEEDGSKIPRNIDYSPSGRLRFDMTPEVITIHPDEETGTRKRGPGELEHVHRRRMGYLVAIFLLCIVPAAVLVVVFVVLDPTGDDSGDKGANTTGSGPLGSGPTTFPPGSFPTLPPANFPSAPIQSPPSNPSDEQSKPPSPTSPTSPTSPSGPPSDPPSVGQDPTGDVLLGLLSRISADGGVALRDPTTPQNAAMQWIRTSNNAGIYQDRVFLQRYALATLYYSTGGAAWTESDAWLTNVTECEWFTSSSISRVCDEEGNLVELNLASNNLRGKVPPEVGLLAEYLFSVELSMNRLTGDIPTSLSRLSILTTLDLSDNFLRGTIPTELASMSGLERLYLYKNFFQSTIPTVLGNMQSLEQLDFGGNQLTGTIPTELARLTELQSLALYNNHGIRGSIPSQIQNMDNLKVLYLDNTALTFLPQAICNTNSLDEFWTDCQEVGGCSCCTKCCEDGEPCI